MSAPSTTQHRRGRRPSRILIAPMAAGALLVAAACSGGTGSTAAPDTLYIGTVNPPASLNPITQADVAGQWSVRFAMDTLMDQPEPLKFVPKLAESIASSDNQKFT